MLSLAQTDNTSVGTTGGGATSNVYSRFGSRIVSLASDTYNPTLGTSRDWVDTLVALDEVDLPAAANPVFEPRVPEFA